MKQILPSFPIVFTLNNFNWKFVKNAELTAKPFITFKTVFIIAFLFGLLNMVEAQTFEPLTVSGYDFDSVAETSPPSTHTTAAVDGSNNVVYQEGYPSSSSGTGMPNSGVITSGSITYNLQAYNGSNALYLPVGTTSGTLTIPTPINAEALHFLAISTEGSASVNIVIEFTDLSTEQIAANATMTDWFGAGVYTIGARINRTTGVITNSGSNPKLNSYSYNISPGNQSKSISKITISKTNSNPRLFIYAVARSFSALPVELIDFQAIAQDGNTSLLTWQTASEVDNEGFEIEKSTDGRNWEMQGFVPGHGTSNEIREYHFTDKKPAPGLNYYRLKQMDFDDNFEYSFVRSVNLENGGHAGISIFPNPVSHGGLNVMLNRSLEENGVLRIFSPTGQLLREEVLSSVSTIISLDGLPAGIYLIEVTDGKEAWRERLVVQ